MLRAILRAVGIGALVCASLAWPPAGVPGGLAAASTCNPSNTHPFWGFDVPPGSGLSYNNVASVDIELERAYLCNSSNRSWAWVGIGNLAAEGLAQAGWAHTTVSPNNCYCYYWEWFKCDDGSGDCADHTAYYGSVAFDTVDVFVVKRVNNSRCTSGDGYCLEMEDVNGVMDCGSLGCPDTDFDPHNAWSEADAIVGSEARNNGDDIMGQTSAYTQYTDLYEGQGGTLGSDPWEDDRTCHVAGGSDYYHRPVVQTYEAFSTYTDPLDHGTNCNSG